uniref:Uncharacterized protein n=1 Tax=Glossina austeni TaxID=7395 RepID=A0A1A9UY55_GLOAU
MRLAKNVLDKSYYVMLALINIGQDLITLLTSALVFNVHGLAGSRIPICLVYASRRYCPKNALRKNFTEKLRQRAVLFLDSSPQRCVDHSIWFLEKMQLYDLGQR